MSYDADHAVAWRLSEATTNDEVALFLSRAHEDAIAGELEPILGPGVHLSDRRFVRQTMFEDPYPLDDPQAPRPSLDLSRVRDEDGFYDAYPDIGHDRFTMIGAGAGSILLASYLTLRGAKPQNITIFDPAGTYGGIWRDPNVRMGGFNNPKSLEFVQGQQLDIRDRNGNNMRDFLLKIAKDNLKKANFIEGTVDELHSADDGTWTVSGRKDGSEADYAVIANGTPHPRKIDSSRIDSNLDNFPQGVGEIVERHQRVLTEKELRSGRPIVLIGLGNSTAAMLNQIHRYQDRSGRKVPYIVLTHRRSYGVANPDDRFDGHNSNNNPIFRDPATGFLTGYSGDIERDEDNYWRAFDNRRIVPEVTGIKYLPRRRKLVVETEYEGTKKIKDPLIFALIGYERDVTLFDAVEARSKKGEPKIRPCDGAVDTITRGYNSNVFAIGAVAATRRNPNAAVVPGILAQVPGTTLTMALRSFVRRHEM